MKVLILLLLPILGFSQHGRFRMDMLVSRVDVTPCKVKIPDSYERILLVLYPDSIRLVTSLDTIALVKVKPRHLDKEQGVLYTPRSDVFVTKELQLYWFIFISSPNGFAIKLIPLEPYRKEPLFGLHMKTI